MTKISQLREQRQAAAAALRNLLDNHPGKTWNAICQREYDSGANELARLDCEINLAEFEQERGIDSRFENAVSIARRERRGRPVDAMFDRFMRRGFDGLEPDERQMQNTLSTTTGSQGGFTVSSNVYSELALIQKRYSAVRSAAQVVPSTVGGPLIWPLSDGTAEAGELLLENVTATAQDPSFASADLKTYKTSSKFIAVPYELIQDSAVNMQEFILNRCGARIGRSQNVYFTTGTGTNQPTGFLPTASVGKTGATGTTVTCTHADLVDLIGSVDPAYRANAVWQMNDVTLRMIRKIADTTNQRPLYLPDSLGPESLLGFEIRVNNDLPSPAANVRSIAFGDFYSGYKIVDLTDQVVLFRITDSTYTKLGQILFLAFQRTAGNLVDASAVKVFVHSAT